MSRVFVNENYSGDNATRAFLSNSEYNYRALSTLVPAAVQLVLCSIAMAAVIRVPALRQGQNVFMANLVLSDILRTVVGVWSFQMFFFRVEAVTDGYLVSCKIFLYLWYFQFFWSMWGTVLIAYSRYSTVSRPLETSLTTRKAAIAAGCACIMGVIIALFPVFGWAQYDVRYMFYSQSYTCLLTGKNDNDIMSFYIFYFALAYGIPLVLVIVFLTQTLQKIIASARNRQRMTYNVQPDSVESSAGLSPGGQSMIKSKALWYVISVIASNVILPAPYIAVLIIGRSIPVSGKAYAATTVIFSVNFVINALLYVFWVRTFLRSLADVLCCRRLRQR
ncbi:opsin-VA-like [Oscarella lobularis]|uniref:opsin-VA-like n=1 Tax=Oscarella lobularis TaxID=121494 RepID=UPI0033134FD0